MMLFPTATGVDEHVLPVIFVGPIGPRGVKR